MKTSHNYESLNKFYIALREVIILIKRSQKEENKYRKISNIFLKSALILLSSKFEAFLENLINEYIYFINENKDKQIPDILKVQHTKEIIGSLDSCFKNTTIKNNRKKIIESMKDLSLIWQNSKSFKPIKISNKFNYGKHGSNAIIKLFNRIGFDDIINEIEITETIKTIDGETEAIIDFRAKINELIQKRNTIIHNDSSILFTKEDLINHIKYLKQFSKKIVNKLDEKLLKN